MTPIPNPTLELIQRIERLEEEKAAITHDIADAFAEAKAQGINVKALKIVIADRKKEREEVLELRGNVATIESEIGA